MTYSIQQIREGLEKAGYVANDEITTAPEAMRNLQLKSRDVPMANLQKYCGRCQPLASIQTIVSH
ncbi:hypothetical protein ME804_03050 [Lactobacillus delbrueckii]|nr:hypothetical protein ME798_05070 [Lactobacillus delbrueckii]GHN56265.1 hypothetical protein ME804_03050 [Lactobacillus delbrueckii]